MNELQQQRAKLEGLVDTQIDSGSGLAINCRNCIHCHKSSSGPGFDKCMKSGGDYCEFIHQFPHLHSHICHNYSSWSPMQKNILELLADKIRKILQ